MAFPAYRLPPRVERGMTGGPTFQNIIQEAVSGVEQRVRVWAKCRGEWDCAFKILDTGDPTGDFQAIVAMFRAHAGDLYPFPFKDWGDYQLTGELIGVGNASATTFQVIKTYDPSQILLGTPGSRTYVRDIYLPRSDLVVRVNGVTQTPGTAYTISSTGEITFATAPPTGHGITVFGEFDTPARFASPKLDLTINELNLAEIGSLPIREVIGAQELA